MAKQSQAPTVLLTRPLAASERFARTLKGWSVVISPLQEIVERDAERPEGAFAAVLFTSENAVRAVQRRGWDLPRQALCVGERTAEVAEKAGFVAESAGGDATDLARLIGERQWAGPLLHPHGQEVRLDFAALGLNVQGVVVYQAESRELSVQAQALLAGDRPVIAPVFSPRSAERLMAARGNLPAPLWFVAMSEAVAQALVLRPGDRIAMSDRPDAPGMRAAMERLLSGGVGQG